MVSGCSSAPTVHADAVFQAASLTKPVIAFVALKLVKEGKLDLSAPVSRYLPDGYAHRQNPFGGASATNVELVPASTLARIPVATLLNPELGLAWGYGWGIETAAGGPYLWQWGNNPGYRAFTMVSASSGNGYVLLTNSEDGMPLAASLARSTIPAEHGVFRFHMLG